MALRNILRFGTLRLTCLAPPRYSTMSSRVNNSEDQKLVRLHTEWLKTYEEYHRCKLVLLYANQPHWFTRQTIISLREYQILVGCIPSQNHKHLFDTMQKASIYVCPYISWDTLKDAPRQVVWLPPPFGFVKMNSDGSFDYNDYGRPHGGCGFVIRDCHGKKIQSCHWHIEGVTDALECEFEALRGGLEKMLELGYLNCVVEGDCLNLLELLNCQRKMEDADFVRLRPLFKLLAQFSRFVISYIPREGNGVADCLARMGLLLPSDGKGISSDVVDERKVNLGVILEEDQKMQPRFRIHSKYC